jgi:hypothetical protein
MNGDWSAFNRQYWENVRLLNSFGCVKCVPLIDFVYTELTSFRLMQYMIHFAHCRSLDWDDAY